MRHRQFQNHHWHRKTEMFSGKFGNSQGDCPGFGMHNYTLGESESLTTRTAGPLALNDRLRAVPGPALRFSPGWQNDWAFGPKSQSDAEYLCITDRAGIHDGALDSRLRGNYKKTSFFVLTKLVGCERRIPDEVMFSGSSSSDQKKRCSMERASMEHRVDFSEWAIRRLLPMGRRKVLDTPVSARHWLHHCS